jgi:hypothetical protein
MRQGCPLSPLLFNIVLEFLARAVRQETDIRGIQIGKKEVKLSLFAVDMILCLKDHKIFTTKLRSHKHGQQSSRIQNQFTKVSISMLNKQSKKETRQTIALLIASKKLKYIGINLMKEMKDPYNNNYKFTEETNQCRH